MRCKISNPKKLRRLSKQVGMKVIAGLVRGNTGHRIDLKIEGEDRYRWSLYPDGTLQERASDFGEVISTKNIKHEK